MNSDPLAKANELYCLGMDPKQMTELLEAERNAKRAVSGAMRGARFLRSGRYANRSMTTPSAPAPTIAAANINAITTAIGSWIGRAAKCRESEVADVRADHEHLAMGEVQELQDPVHHRVADGDQSVDAPEREAGDELIEEIAPRQLVVLEVADDLKGVHGRAVSEQRAAHRDDGPHA